MAARIERLNGDIEIPATAAEITAEWLTAALRRPDDGEAVTVTGFRPAAMDENVGVVGAIGRIDLTYDRPVAGMPESLVVKLAAADPRVAATSARLGLYSTEVGYYRHLSVGCPARPPVCYYADISKRGDRFVLLLEALEGYSFASFETGCSFEEAKVVVTALARLHGRHWGAAHLLQHRWLARPPVLARRLGSTVKRGLPLCREAFPDLLPEGLMARIDEALPRFDAVLADFCGRNLTLNHGDSHLNNMIVRDGGVRFYDWQTCAINNCAYDLAYFLNGNLADGVRATHIGELVGLYHAVLTGESGARLSADEVMAEYLAASGVVTVLGVAIAGAFLSGTPKGRRIAEVLLARTGAAEQETDGLARLMG